MARLESRRNRSLFGALTTALLAAGCGTAVPDGFWASEGEGLSGAPSESVFPPKWTNAAKIAVRLQRPPGADGAFEACVTATAPDTAAPFSEGATWACASPAVKVTFGANDATKSASNVPLPTGEGLKKVWAKFSDKTGTGAIVASVESATVLVDKTPPAQRPGSAVIRGAASSIIVTLNASATDFGGSGLSGYKLVQSPTAAPKAGCTSGTPLACRADRNVLTCGGLKNGAKLSVRLCAVDRAGNTSPGILNDYVVPVPAWHQDKPPTNVSLVLRGTPNAASGGKVDVTLSGASPDGTKLVRSCVAEEGAECTLAAIKPEAVSVTLSATATLANAKTGGRRTLVGQVVDAYGLVGSATLSFDYDLTPPADAGMTLSVEAVDRAVRAIVDGAPSDTDRFIASAIKSATAAPAPGCVAKTAAGGVPESFVLTSVGGNKTEGWLFDAAKFVNGAVHKVRVCAVDAAGNASEGRVSDPVTYAAAPTGAIVVGTGSTSAQAVGAGPVKVTLSAKAVGTAKVKSYFLTTDPAAARVWTNFTTAAASAKQTIASFDLGAAGPKTLYAWFKDDLGNESASPATVQTYRDGQKPVVALSNFAVLPWAGGSYQVNVGVTVTEDSGLLKALEAKLFPSATATGAGKAMTCAAVGPLAFDCSGVVTAPGKVSISATATDLVGNVSEIELMEGEDVGVDLTAPTEFDQSGTLRATTLSYEPDGTFTAQLDWDPAPDADAVAYLVVRSASDEPPDDCDSGTFVGSTAATTLLVPGLEGEPQAFRVCAVDLSGNVSAGRTAVLGGGNFRITKVNGLAAKRVQFLESDPVVVEGIAEPGAVVELFSMGVGKVGSATANADGVWQLSLTGRDSYLLAAHSTDKDGKPVRSPPVEVTIGAYEEPPPPENIPMTFDTEPYDQGNTFTIEGVAPAWSDDGGAVHSYQDHVSVAGTAPKAGYVFSLRHSETGALLATVTAGADKRWSAGPFPLSAGQSYTISGEKPGAEASPLFDFSVMHELQYPEGPYRERYVAGSTLEAPKYRGLGKVDGSGGALARFGAVSLLKELPGDRLLVGHVVDDQTNRLAELDLWSGAVRDLGAWDGQEFAPVGGSVYSYGPMPGSSSGGLRLRRADGSLQLVAADVVADRDVVDMAGDGRRVAVLTMTTNTDPPEFELRLFTLAEDGASAGTPLLVSVPWEQVQNSGGVEFAVIPPSGIAFGPDGRLYVQRARLWRLDEQTRQLEVRPSKFLGVIGMGPLSFDASGRMLHGAVLEAFPRLLDLSQSGGPSLLTRSGFLVVARMGLVEARATAFVPAQATMLTATSPWELTRLLDLGVLVAKGVYYAPPPSGYENCAVGASSDKNCVCESGWGNGYNECKPCGTGAHRIDFPSTTGATSGSCVCDDRKDGDPYVACADVPADVATLCGGAYKTLDDATRSIDNTTSGWAKDYTLPRNTRTDWQGSGWYRFAGSGGSTLTSFDPTVAVTCDKFTTAAPCRLSSRCGTRTQLYLVEGQPTTGAVEWKTIGAGSNYGSTPAKPTPYTVGALRCSGFNLYYLPDFVSKSLDGGWCTSP